jgi:hypothetical protein
VSRFPRINMQLHCVGRNTISGYLIIRYSVYKQHPNDLLKDIYAYLICLAFTGAGESGIFHIMESQYSTIHFIHIMFHLILSQKCH